MSGLTDLIRVQLGTALLVALDHKITKQQYNKIIFHLVFGYGRSESPSEIQALLQQFNDGAAELVNQTNTNILNMERETPPGMSSNPPGKSTITLASVASSENTDSDDITLRRGRKSNLLPRRRRRSPLRAFIPDEDEDNDEEEHGPLGAFHSDIGPRTQDNIYVDLSTLRPASSPIKLMRRPRVRSNEGSTRVERDIFEVPSSPEFIFTPTPPISGQDSPSSQSDIKQCGAFQPSEGDHSSDIYEDAAYFISSPIPHDLGTVRDAESQVDTGYTVRREIEDDISSTERDRDQQATVDRAAPTLTSEGSIDDIASRQCSLDAVTRRRPREPSCTVAQKGSRNFPLELESESDTECARDVARGKKSSRRLIGRECGRSGKRKSQKAKDVTIPVLQHPGAGTSALRAPLLDVAASQISLSEEEHHLHKNAESKGTRLEYIESSASAAEHVFSESLVPDKKSVKREKKRRRLASIPLQGAQLSSAPSSSSSHVHERGNVALSQPPGPSLREQALAAMRKDKQVRASAPAPAFMTTNIAMTELAIGCGDRELSTQTETVNLAIVNEEAKFPGEYRLTSPSDRPNAIPISQHTLSEQPISPKTKNPATESGLDFELNQSSDQRDQNSDFRLRRLNFNQRMIAAREQLIRETQATGRPSELVNTTSCHGIKSTKSQASNQQRGGPGGVLPNEPRSMRVNNRWHRRSWSRHSRSPSGERSYILWGGIVVRTSWNDSDRTMVNSDSDLEITHIPRPARWR